ncbi:hypothetical protein [Dyella choica]|uniref:Uncharacterized protein n=1 Tax=Dyella choica TaxID=1927959 RepID=A0A432M0V7_9GAMM|nr:hypothetical protein [Dyella choica]RUL70550.1 hypothetical protein EKH80_20380 [Dyella choica]
MNISCNAKLLQFVAAVICKEPAFVAITFISLLCSITIGVSSCLLPYALIKLITGKVGEERLAVLGMEKVRDGLFQARRVRYTPGRGYVKSSA